MFVIQGFVLAAVEAAAAARPAFAQPAAAPREIRGAYRNTPDDLLAQIARVRKPENGQRADDVSLFSYAVPQIPPNEPLEAAVDPLAFLGAAFPLSTLTRTEAQ